jgi:hypothetical protein
MKNKAVILTAGVIVLFGGIAQGRLVGFSTDEIHSWSFSGVVITQAISNLTPKDVIMTADSDSTFTVTSTTTNMTDFTWTGYILALAPAGSATFVEGSAGSTKFATALFPNLWTLEFSNGEVLPGKVVTFQFDVSIPEGPSYTFSLTQTPIPEPATFALLGLGALVFVAGRRK